MESKCPCCGGNRDSGFAAESFSCIDCMFMCETKDLPRIAAAMELARMEYALEHCEPQYEHEYQFHLELAKKHVLEVFGGE